MQVENNLKGKYTLDVQTEGKFIITPTNMDDEPIEINVPKNYTVSQPYIVRFEKKDDKYIMLTDVNGACSEVYVDISKISENDPIKDVRLDTDYLYFSFVIGETAEEVEKAEPQPVYVQISDLIDTTQIQANANYIQDQTSSQILSFDEKEN